MGEARTRLQRLLATHPLCAYCGALATSADHCPPIAVFDNGFRPKGLEVPACYECHTPTRKMDMVVAVVSRFFSSEKAPLIEADVRRHSRGLLNNVPEVAELFVLPAPIDTTVDGRPGKVMEIRDPDRLTRIITAFAARLVLALYHDTYGEPAPLDTLIAARMFQNTALFQGEYPEEVVKLMGEPRTLAQGKLSVEHQFRYWQVAPDEKAVGFGVFAVFRQAFAIMAAAQVGGGTPPDGPGDAIEYKLGFLHSFEV